MDSHLSDLQRLLKNGQKSDSFDAYFEQPFNTTTSRTDLKKVYYVQSTKRAKPDWLNENIYET